MGASFYFVEIKIFTSVGARPHFHMIFHYYLYLPLKLFFFFLKRSKVLYIKIYSVQKGIKSVSVGYVVHRTKLVGTCQGRASHARSVPTGPDQRCRNSVHAPCVTVNYMTVGGRVPIFFFLNIYRTSDYARISSFCFTLYSL